MHRRLVSNSYARVLTSWTSIYEEAVMAAIAFNTAQRAAERLETALVAVVKNLMCLSATVEHSRKA